MKSIRLLQAAFPVRCACAAFALLAAQVSLPAGAQPTDAPPKLEKLEEPEPVRAPQQAQPAQRIIETRDRRGQVNSIEVRGERGSYYVKPGSAVGNAAPGGPESDQVRAPQWKVFEFDSKRPDAPDKSNAAGAAPAEVPPPPITPARAR
jgi:hypothetical protein